MEPLRTIVACVVLVLASLVRADAAAPLTLDECISRALATIPRLAEAGAGLDLSSAQRREEAASLFPSVRSDIQYLQEPGYREAITNRGLSAGQLIADYLVYDGGRRLARVHAAKYAEQASQFGLAAARSEVVYDTTVTFYGLIRAIQVAAESQSSIEQLSRYSTVIQALRASGRATADDVLRIDLLLRDGRIQSNSAVHSRARASFALGALIGEYGRSDIAVTEPRDSMFHQDPGADGVDNNPALRALQRTRASAAQGLAAAKAERYPTLRMELTSGFLGTDPPSTVERYAGASYGGVLSIPLFEGGAIRARIDQAGARLHQTDAQISQARIDLAERLVEAQSQYDEARQSLKLLHESLPTAEGSFELSWSRFLGGGSTTLLEVVTSYSQMLATRLAVIDQEFAVHQAVAQILQVSGADTR